MLPETIYELPNMKTVASDKDLFWRYNCPTCHRSAAPDSLVCTDDLPHEELPPLKQHKSHSPMTIDRRFVCDTCASHAFRVAKSREVIVHDNPWGDNEEANAARAKRSLLLSQSDWTQMPDALTEDKRVLWTAYRKELRDITKTFSSPVEVEWPVSP